MVRNFEQDLGPFMRNSVIYSAATECSETEEMRASSLNTVGAALK
jgi:hypothetical protein